MDDQQRQKLYDEVVEVELAHPNGGGNVVKRYFSALYDYCETPEEALASALVNSCSYSEHNRTSENFPEFAAVRWHWGDARGLLRAGGHTYFEARLRLRDKLVESARSVTRASEPETREVTDEYETPLHELVALCREQNLALDISLYGSDEQALGDDTHSTYHSGARLTGHKGDPMDVIREGVCKLRAEGSR